MPIKNHIKSHLDIYNAPNHIPPMSENTEESEFSMGNLIETRQRYQRMLEALGYTSRIDRDLRAELVETIENFDRKIGAMSTAANRTIPPGTIAFRRETPARKV
ncbi:MAG: hypothetical protein AAFP68_12105 [Pseudomonadota bacterium]